MDTRPLRHVLHVALVTETYPPEINGVAMTLGRLVAGLTGRGHQVLLVRPRQGADDRPTDGVQLRQFLVPGIRIPRYDMLRAGLPVAGRLTRLWRGHRPDVVHIATEGPLGWAALRAARRLGLPVSSGFHTNFHSYSRHYGLGWALRPIRGYLRLFHNRADCTLVPTEAMRRELEQDGFRRVRVVGRGVDTTQFHPHRRSAALRASWGVGDDVPVALYAGRLAAEKNLELVCRAFTAMQAEDSRARLVLVGDGPQRAALEARFPGHVYAGMRTGMDLAQHYASADVFLFASTTETFGNVTLEALASGLAVVAYDYAAARDHVRSDSNGLTMPVDDEPAFVAAARRLAREPHTVARLRRRAPILTGGADWPAVLDAFESALLSVARGDGNDPLLAVHVAQP